MSGHLYESVADFKKSVSDILSEELTTLRFNQKTDLTLGVKVFFITDTFKDNPDEMEDEELQELSCFFEKGVASLFGRMIKAMGLTSQSYVMSALTKEQEEDRILREHLISEILFFKPDFIVSLGAKATNELLGTEKRLKNIHGQFFDLNFQDQGAKMYKATLMPLFSPKLLHIAPNMKKTAWRDMQKLMEKF